MPQLTVKAARINAGLTQKEAAKALGISYQTLSHYERDSSQIRQATLDKMYEVYRLDKRQIFLK